MNLLIFDNISFNIVVKVYNGEVRMLFVILAFGK